jgi:hypothetical protein
VSDAPVIITKREEALWDLLDDIDTAFDIYRPQMEAFERYVQQKVEARHLILSSDGYKLYAPPRAKL